MGKEEGSKGWKWNGKVRKGEGKERGDMKWKTERHGRRYRL